MTVQKFDLKAWKKKRKEDEKKWKAEYEAQEALLASARSKLTKEEYDAVLQEGHLQEYL